MKTFGGINPLNSRFCTLWFLFFIFIFVLLKIRQYMNQIITYLTFNGNCREAMEFYQKCLGGELKFQTLEDTPKAEKFPKDLKDYVVQAVLKKEDMLLMGTDMVDKKLVRGNSISILLDASNEDQAKEYYQKLKEGSAKVYPMRKTYWGDLFGGLVDRYGNEWLFHCKNNENKTV